MDAHLYEYQWGSRDLNPGPTDYENLRRLFEGVRDGPFRAQDTDPRLLESAIPGRGFVYQNMSFRVQ